MMIGFKCVANARRNLIVFFKTFCDFLESNHEFSIQVKERKRYQKGYASADISEIV
jgi:hypothetical protein